eukprot:TRINITY_DN492_c0_g1_i1.p1 TRINITY_DN492_c0_g1~~TRINITY_DN492_c0_g1_i1.p1  ORF type:complete len:210 (-),score=39.74 TRINITY_DN492_c0_g1_i1:113-715(-)
MLAKLLRLDWFLYIAIACSACCYVLFQGQAEEEHIHKTASAKFFEFTPLDIHKKPYPFKDLEGKVVLIVNVASHCGFTGQYKGLQQLYDKYKDRGFVVIGFPCNQFGSQEPGSNDEIESFCSRTYSVTFPIMDKIEVNGDNVHPVYEYLKTAKPGILGLTRIKWNFEKFLVDQKGNVVDRWASTSSPEGIASSIEKLLNK